MEGQITYRPMRRDDITPLKGRLTPRYWNL